MISACKVSVDHNNRETVAHGTTEFPVACYHEDVNVEIIPWHWHDEMEALFVRQGRVDIHVGKDVYEIRAGEGFFINAGIVHCYFFSPHYEQDDYSMNAVVFHPRIVGAGAESIFHRRYIQPVTDNVSFAGCILKPDVPWQAGMLMHVKNCWDACKAEDDGYEIQVRFELTRLMEAMAGNLHAQVSKPDARTLRDTDRLKKMLHFIEENYASAITAADIAGSASVSESEALRCFKSVIGTTPVRYLREYRITVACAMLNDGGLRSTDVAFACGFQDLSYFTKIFKAEKGCTPGEYARKHKK